MEKAMARGAEEQRKSEVHSDCVGEGVGQWRSRCPPHPVRRTSNWEADGGPVVGSREPRGRWLT
eukprot:5357684-Lingulodinium_polyedra.AAC.1